MQRKQKERNVKKKYWSTEGTKMSNKKIPMTELKEEGGGKWGKRKEMLTCRMKK